MQGEEIAPIAPCPIPPSLQKVWNKEEELLITRSGINPGILGEEMSKEIGKIEAELKDVERRLNEQKERIDKYLGFPIYGEEPRKWKFQGVPCSESSVHFIDYMMQWAYHVGKSGMHMGTVTLDGNDMYIEHISHRDMSHLNGCDPMCPKCGLTLLLVDKPDSPIILCSSCDYRETEEEWLKEQEKK